MVVGGTVETITLDHWDLAQDVNVRAMYLVSRAAVPHMREAGGGAIVNIASVAAFRGSTERPSHAYAASKGAVLSLTRGSPRTSWSGSRAWRRRGAASRWGGLASPRTSRTAPCSSRPTKRRSSRALTLSSTAARWPSAAEAGS